MNFMTGDIVLLQDGVEALIVGLGRGFGMHQNFNLLTTEGSYIIDANLKNGVQLSQCHSNAPKFKMGDSSQEWVKIDRGEY